MNDKRYKMINMLDNVIRISTTLLSSELIDTIEGADIVRTLKGIRSRFSSAEYMRQSPQGYIIDEIDEMILPMDRLLLEAGKKRYKNTIACILDAVIYGAGICHRILKDEEKKQEAYVLMRRKTKLDKYLDKIVTAKQLDEKLESRQFVQSRKAMLQKNSEAYQKKIDYFKQYRPNIVEELLYYTDAEDMSPEAQEYLNLTLSLDKMKSGIEESDDALNNIEFLVKSYKEVLQAVGKEVNSSVKTEIKEVTDAAKAKEAEQAKMEAEQVRQAEREKAVKEVEKGELKSQKISSYDDEQEIEAKMRQIQKIVEKFVDTDGFDMIDLEYQMVNRAFSSPELRAYVAQSVEDFKACGLNDFKKWLGEE